MEVPQIPGVTLENQVKFIGITIDSRLIPHICLSISFVKSWTLVFKKISNISDVASANAAYFTLCESHLRYGLVVWGAASASNIQRILLIQKKAIITLAPKTEYMQREKPLSHWRSWHLLDSRWKKLWWMLT